MMHRPSFPFLPPPGGAPYYSTSCQVSSRIVKSHAFASTQYYSRFLILILSLVDDDAQVRRLGPVPVALVGEGGPERGMDDVIFFVDARDGVFCRLLGSESSLSSLALFFMRRWKMEDGRWEMGDGK